MISAPHARSRAAVGVSAALVLVVLGFLAYFVWPTPWRYDHVTLKSDRFPVRTHRITDRTEILLGPQGWVVAGDEPAAPEKPPQPFTREELEKVKGTLAVTGYGWLILNLHNGTEKRVRELHIELVITHKKSGEEVKREYKLPVHAAQPLSAFTVKAECGCRLSKDEDYTWHIVAARAE